MSKRCLFLFFSTISKRQEVKKASAWHTCVLYDMDVVAGMCASAHTLILKPLTDLT